MYVLHELASTLTVQPVPIAPNGTSTILANVSIIPPDPPAGAEFAAGEILIPPLTPSYTTPYIYVSNRNTGVQDPRGDAIDIYKRTETGLELISRTYTGLDQIRGMMIGPNGGEDAQRYLIAAGVAGSAGTVVYERTQDGTNLTEIARNLDYPTRTTFVWLE
jgi:6-phosphogluconolactonase (cycloisomerase 2 family)